MKIIAQLLSILLLLSLCQLAHAADISSKYDLHRGSPEIQSMSKLAIGDDGILFIGDSKGAQVIALATSDRLRDTIPSEFELVDLEGKLSTRLGIGREDVLIQDMVVHPLSKNIYLSVSAGRGLWEGSWQTADGLADATLLVRVNVASMEISEVVLDDVFHSVYAFQNPPHIDTLGARRSTITDMKYNKGKLMISGLSGQEFRASLRQIDFPFRDLERETELEMYHFIHDNYETRSPVSVFETHQVKEQEKLLAVYYCSPLVSFDLQSLNSADKVRGETISELWPGSSKPLDMLIYEYAEIKYVLVALSNRGLARYRLDDIAQFDGDLTVERKSLTPDMNYRPVFGVEFTIFPGPVQQLDNYDEASFMAVQRHENGQLYLKLRSKRYLSIT